LEVAKIKQSPEWVARKEGYANLQYCFVGPLHQQFAQAMSRDAKAMEKYFTVSNKMVSKCSLSQCKIKANKIKKLGKGDDPVCDVSIDKMYWSEFESSAFYCSDQNCFLFDQDQMIWNLNK
jgi:hypothetical protein